MSAHKVVCSLPSCDRAAAGRCPSCQTVYCSNQCQHQDWAAHRHHYPQPPPLQRFPPTHLPVKVAKLSKELPSQMLEKKKLYEVLPVEHFESPSDFTIRLKFEVKEGL